MGLGFTKDENPKLVHVPPEERQWTSSPGLQVTRDLEPGWIDGWIEDEGGGGGMRWMKEMDEGEGRMKGWREEGKGENLREDGGMEKEDEGWRSRMMMNRGDGSVNEWMREDGWEKGDGWRKRDGRGG